MIYQMFNNVLGQVKGFGRLRIRGEVAGNVRLPREAMEALRGTLFRQRVGDAVERFPLYAARAQEKMGRLPGGDEDIELHDLPIWTREDQKRHFESFDGPLDDDWFVHCTGGSSGQPLRFHVSRESYEWRMAVSDRGYSWAGAEEGRKSFFVWGAPALPISIGQRIKSTLHHCVQRRAFFDSFQFGDEEKEACCRDINRFRPNALVGYAGNLVELAKFVAGNPGLLKWRAQSVVTAAEGLRGGERELLEDALGGRVFMSYGSREFMLIGMECSEHAGYHISSDNLIVEIVDEDGKVAAAGKAGRILVTDLRNAATPFIRYEIGDIGVIDDEQCSCGLPFPMLRRVDGRIQEIIYGTDGSKLSALFIPHLFKEFLWIDGYQLVQDKRSDLQVNIVCGCEVTKELSDPVREELLAKLGREMKIGFVRVEKLQKSASGKTPIVLHRD